MLSDDDLQNVIVHCDTPDVAHTVLRIETQQRHEGLLRFVVSFGDRHFYGGARHGVVFSGITYPK
jgi:hypothetical protein